MSYLHMPHVTNYRARMSLSDLLDRTARLTGKVFVRGLILGLVTMIPAGLVMGFAMREIFAALADTMHRLGATPEPSLDAVAPLFYGLFEMGIAVLLYLVGSTIMHASMIDMTDAAIHSAPRTWQGAFARGSHAAVRVLLQYVVMVFVVASLLGFGIVVGVVVLQQWAVAVLLIGGAIVVTLWIVISWSFAPQAVVCEHDSALQGLARSRLLVRGGWWRVFGILLLIGILVQFAVTIVTAPLQGMAFASFLPDMIEMEKNMLSHPNDSAMLEPMLLKLSALGWQLGFVQAVSGILVGIVQAVYGTLLYYDLRARQGEFDDELPETTA